jgi:DNA excision repair protein ERCC-6
LEERIAKSAASTSRIAKLFERLDELKEEEAQLLELVQEAQNNFTSRTKSNTEGILNILNDESDFEVDEKEKEVTSLTTSTVTSYTNSELKDAYEIAAHHHITDDFSNVDYGTRIDEWLACEKFADWRQHRNYFVNRSLQDQISFELTCFDIVLLMNGSFIAPKCLWDELFEYQREGVEWMLKLWEGDNGGVLGDEMGLGKTVQVVAFLAVLQISGKLDEPNLIVAPSTLLRQWVRELNTWWPPLRTILLHSSSTAFNETKSVKSFLLGLYPKSHVFITSYGTCSSSSLQKILLTQKWNSIVLDEGHKIRNPDAQITLICKQLQSLRRFVLSGTPIQNNLTELWSLFDFVRPGLLGSLPLFKAEMALPINIGGYTNASLFQVQTSYRCACTLRDLIMPFLLRRLKRNVLMNNGNLPDKKEEIVFCRITPYQKQLYEAFISSDDVEAIIERRRNLLAGIDILRKICNHPDLLEHVIDDEDEEEEEEEESRNVYNGNEGYLKCEASLNLVKSFNNLKKPADPIERSGKLNVLEKILELWHSQGHRVLIFCQTRQMLNLIEEFLQAPKREEYKYLRMDGTTPIKQRLQMVDRFNSATSPFFIFLLTTRVGGLGINLTGADRVIIYDPDWNPSTDLQARERVYRLGQTRPVSILRLITAGTIEEKIYHRQIFKQFLTQRILEDPKQTRFFKAADLHDLFELNVEETTTETADMFAGLEEEITRKMENKRDIKRDDPVLDDLLEMVGVHSTLPTTGITETIRPEYALIQKEADKIAQSALEALQKSQENNGVKRTKSMTEIDHLNQFKPTWTGKFGSNAKFGGNLEDENEKNDTEITAKDILNAINQRKAQSSSSSANPLTSDSNLKLALDLVDYFNRVGGRVASDRLAHAFRSQVQSSDSAVIFRSLLKKVAEFDKTTRIWRLEKKFMK